MGDLSGITAKTASSVLRPFAFPPLELALDPVWDRKLSTLAERSLAEPITLVSGVSSCLLALFQRLTELTGKETVAEVWPELEVVVHGGVKFEPYREAFAEVLGDPHIRLQESYACSEGFLAFGDPATGLLRLVFDHGIFYEFVPVEELGSDRPTRHWLGNIQAGINYAIVVSNCAGMWAHVIGDTVRFESTSPPLLTFTGRTKYTLSAFGEHLINEEVEGAVASASTATEAAIRDWHVGPVFRDPLGYHLYVFEFHKPPGDLDAFRLALDADLGRRNADYQWYRDVGARLPLPALVVAKPGGFDDWMRSRGKLGGQHKVPRMDNAGTLTNQLVSYPPRGRPGRVRDLGRHALLDVARGRPVAPGRLQRQCDGLKPLLLLGDQPGDLADGIEVLDPRLVGLDRDLESFLEEDDELERADRVEDAARDQGGLLGQLLGILAGQEFAEDVVVDGLLDLFHGDLRDEWGGNLRGRGRRPFAGSQAHSAPKPAASRVSKRGSASITGRLP